MDGTPQLLTNIQFGEAKKGYDRDQVDKFLLELSLKVGELQDMLRETAQRAEAAEAKLAEANKAKTQAEGLVEQARADADAARGEAAAAAASAALTSTQAPAVVNDIEAASGILAMAQKTADAAVEEAEKRAKDVIADARAKAAMIVVEVEQDVERIRTEAASEAEVHVNERTGYAEAEVDRLAAKREGLQAEADNLQIYLDEHRRLLRDEVASLTALLEGSEHLASDKVDRDTDDPEDDGPEGGRSTDEAAVIDVDAAEADTKNTTTSAASAASEPPAPADSLALTSAAPAMLFGDFEGPDASFRQLSEEGTTSEHAMVATDPGVAGPLVVEPLVVEPLVVGSLVVESLVVESLMAEPVVVVVADPAAPAEVVLPAPVELAVVTLEDLTAPSAASTPDERVKRTSDPEAELRAVQIPSLLEAPLPAPTSIAASVATPVIHAVPDARPVTVAATGTDGVPSGVVSSTARPATIDLTANGLFAAAPIQAGATTGEATQAHDVLGDEALANGPRLVLQRSAAPADDSSPLGEPDADADAAMRAFFEQDVDEVVKEVAKGRFLRRK